MVNPADEADIGEQIGEVKIIFFKAPSDSPVKTRKLLEIWVRDYTKSGAGYIAGHALPVANESLRPTKGNPRSAGDTPEHAAQNLFRGLQLRLYELRRPDVGVQDPTDRFQRDYLEVVLDMPAGYNPNS